MPLEVELRCQRLRQVQQPVEAQVAGDLGEDLLDAGEVHFVEHLPLDFGNRVGDVRMDERSRRVVLHFTIRSRQRGGRSLRSVSAPVAGVGPPRERGGPFRRSVRGGRSGGTPGVVSGRRRLLLYGHAQVGGLGHAGCRALPCRCLRARAGRSRGRRRSRRSAGSDARSARPAGWSARGRAAACTTLKISWMTMGARPRDGSSMIRMRGLDISARATATICCSPPESVRASWLSRSLRRGKSEKAFSKFSLRSALARLCADPTSRFSCDRHLREQAPALRHLHDTGANDGVGAHLGEVHVFERHRAGRRLGEARDGVHERRLAGAVGADDADDLSLSDVDGHVVEGAEHPVLDHEVLDAKQWRPPPQGRPRGRPGC